MKTIENIINSAGVKELSSAEMIEVNGGCVCRGPAFAAGVIWQSVVNAVNSAIERLYELSVPREMTLQAGRG